MIEISMFTTADQLLFIGQTITAQATIFHPLPWVIITRLWPFKPHQTKQFV